MSRKLLLVVFICGIFFQTGYSQKLKLRVTSGYHFPTTSFSPNLFWPETVYKPNPTSDFVFTKMWMPPAPFNHPYFSFGLEWESKNKSHYELRYHPYEGAEYILSVSWNDISSVDPISGVINVEKVLWAFGFLMPREKISFSATLSELSYMIPVKSGGFQFQPMAGLAYMFVPIKLQNGGKGSEEYGISTFPDRMYNDSIQFGLRESTLKNHTIQTFAGIHCRYYSKKENGHHCFFISNKDCL
jgi:hypothetical protein